MSLADSLLADLDGLSDGEDAPSPPPSNSKPSGSGSGSGPAPGPPGMMLPPPLPMKAKRLADDLDASAGPSSSSSKRAKLSNGNGVAGHDAADGDEEMGDDGEEVGEGGVRLGFVPEGGVRPADELDEDEVNKTDLTGVEDIGKVAKLANGKKLKEVLADIARYSNAPSDMSTSSGPLEENPEYSLVVNANNMSVEVDNEILIVHKFIRDHYAPRFPELEQLIADPWTYIAAVRAIANTDDLTKCVLPTTLPAATILSINLATTITKGRKLSEGEWRTVERATEVAHELRIAREQIFAYVESRMAAVAPNLSAIVGTAIAAKLLGLAGGLQAFSRQPSCNIMLFGAQKRTLANSHLSAASQQRHTGFIYQSSIVQSAQPEDRRRAQRAVSAKCVLAARVDAGKSARDGSLGKRFLAELQKRIEKMAEPPPNKMAKALPIPQETIRKKRGGKRARKQKEAYAQTELRKLQNRMEFGKAEEEFGMDDETVGLGMVGQGSGRVRGEQVDARSKAKLSRANRIRTQMLGRSSTSADAKSGTSTSLSFTPVQGIEIVTPSLSAAAKVQQANERWFAGGTFTHVKKEASSIPGQASGSSTGK